jgi:hypothetical protein
VILPLLKPAIVAALVYSFVRAVTTVSAVIFLVSAEYEMATTYIINRVVNGDYGVAIAYCSVLIVLMLLAIGAMLVGSARRRVGDAAAVGPASVRSAPPRPETARRKPQRRIQPGKPALQRSHRRRIRSRSAPGRWSRCSARRAAAKRRSCGWWPASSCRAKGRS